MNVGYPDGDNRPTVTMDYRRTYTITPTAGVVSFGIGTGFHGCFIKGSGVVVPSTPIQSTYIGANGTQYFTGPVSSLSSASRGLVPMFRVDSVTPTPFAAYRPIVAVAEVVFTGSTMENGGSVVIAKTSTANSLRSTFGSSLERPEYIGALVNPAMTGTSVVGPARDSYTSRIVPADPEFQPYQVAATLVAADDPQEHTNTLVYAGASTDRRACSFPCPQAGAVWYSYSGLHSSATITVSVRYCAQYVVKGDSEMVPLARPSPPPPDSPSVMSRIFSAVTNSPVALNFAAGALAHAFPASRPLLAIAADAYNSSH